MQMFTTRKRSLAQGNVFIGVYHSVHRGEGVSIQGGLPRGDLHQGEEESVSRGIGVCIWGRGVCIWKGLHQGGLNLGGSASRGGLHPCAPMELEKQVAHILLECFLVYIYI